MLPKLGQQVSGNQVGSPAPGSVRTGFGLQTGPAALGVGTGMAARCHPQELRHSVPTQKPMFDFNGAKLYFFIS